MDWRLQLKEQVAVELTLFYGFISYASPLRLRLDRTCSHGLTVTHQ